VKVSEILEQKGSHVATLAPDTTVRFAVAELNRYRIGALVVSTDGQRVEGIVSERDVVRGLSERADGLLESPISVLMSSSVHTCGLDDDTETLMQAMTVRRIRHVPVVRDGVLCGIVSIGDIVKSRIGELEKDRNELVEYINAR
jgi:CBS domain-containing protein